MSQSVHALDERGISVSVRSEYLAEPSSPSDQRYVFAYHIRIENQGKRTVRLLTRHWIITNSESRVQEVRGDGVIGEQPVLAPGEFFEYTSGTVIETPVGSMHGSYGMLDEIGERFESPIPAFTLAIPRVLN
ncbi:ApaG protein [Paraperlucidibaca baekdonensis]|uniref:Protein ApaG n=1 Tax=Paraperlucidibaca baekdonensis TaxID=748120 RepID=A0A3E0H9Y7_9GAMM|nr:Co2+/Mg2+ efflux protein ApaG [Paraperlucidibaca baekdonensis]REH40350.1 ApaG protein [Paraperlucidibaca baekdonensis]